VKPKSNYRHLQVARGPTKYCGRVTGLTSSYSAPQGRMLGVSTPFDGVAGTISEGERPTLNIIAVTVSDS
jgi:hypothetical protein